MPSALKLLFLALVVLSTVLHSVSPKNYPELSKSSSYAVNLHDKYLTEAQEDGIHQAEINSLSSLKYQTILAELFTDVAKYREEIYDSLFDNVTQECAGQFKAYLEGIATLPLPETWALQMADAWGKFPDGLLSGNSWMAGDFQQCIQIRGTFKSDEDSEGVPVKGKYCTTILAPGPTLMKLIEAGNNGEVTETGGPSLRKAASLEELILHILSFGYPQITPMMGTCFPAVCSNDDVSQILTYVHKKTELFTQSIFACTTEEKPPLGAGEYTMIVVLSIIALVCICGTCIDVLAEDAIKQRTGMKILLAFSFYTNTQRWLSTKVGSDNFGCFHGLRFLSMCWVLLSHSFSAAAAIYFVSNKWDLKTMHKDWTLYPILNGFVAVDTFFVIGGFLVCYNLMRELDRAKGRFNYIMFVVHRYLRITPTLMIIIGVWTTLTPYLGNGPFWFFLESQAKECRKYWWHNLLYINNLVGFGNGKCYNVSWYLGVEMQFFVLSPLVIYPMWKWRKLGLSLFAALSLASIAIPTVLTAYHNIPPTTLPHIDIESLTNKKYMADTYAKPWARFGSYLVGMGAGYVLYLGKQKPGMFKKLPKVAIILGWTLSTAFALAIVYGVSFYLDPENTEETLNSAHGAIYGGLHRFVWSLCIAWIIFACVNGHGGWANKILSMKIFIPLGRLSFCMYLVQFQTLMPYYFRATRPHHFSKFTATTEYLGLLLITGGVSYVAMIALESPFMQLEKMIFAPKRQPAKQAREAESKE